MKILVIHTFNQAQNGDDNVVRNEIKLLSAYGLEVELICLAVPGSTFSSILQTAFNYASYRKVKRRIKFFKPDVVHLHHLDFGSLAAAVHAARKAGTALVYTPHNYSLLCPSGTLFYKDKLYTDAVGQPFPYQSIKEGIYMKSQPRTLILALSMFLHHLLRTWNSIDKIIVAGEPGKALFLQSKLKPLADRIIVNPVFCFPPAQERTQPVRTPYYLYAGNFSDEDGLPVLLEAFADNGLPVKVAGRGYLKKLVFGYTEFYPNIGLIETDDADEISGLFENAAALIFPPVWYEPFGSMIVKAFSMGVPVIASDLGNAGEMVAHGYNGLLFEAGNDRDLREKIGQFQLLTEKERRQYRTNALHTYQHTMNPEKFAPGLISLYESLFSPLISKNTQKWG